MELQDFVRVGMVTLVILIIAHFQAKKESRPATEGIREREQFQGEKAVRA
jgi:hypothetical protein